MMLPRNTDWTKYATWIILGIVGLLVIGALPDIFEGTGAADTTRSAGHAAGSAARGAGGYAHNAGSHAASGFAAVFPKLLLVIGVAIILFKVFGAANRRGGNARGGNNALRNAQREEYQAIAAARNEAQQQVTQARNDASRRRDQAVHAAQAQVSAEQDRWVS